ncbi:MAG: hypothetical protein KIT43_15095 [Bauldia sp.]|nr:hypothetical protein [Bauldia sp.]MCW5718239.1 hypothetical protein [Bauldia sp.]
MKQTTGTEPAWRPIDTAPRDGQRILAVVRATEQWPAEVELVRWGDPGHGADKSWIAADSGARGLIVFAEGELVSWMPLPHPPEGA